MVDFEIQDRMYKQNIRIIVSDDEDHVINTIIKDYNLPEEHLDYISESISGSHGGAYIKLKCNCGSISIIWLREYYYQKPLCCGILSHEIIHMTSDIFWERGIKITEETNENYAYYVGWVTENVIEGIMNERKQKRGSKKKKA